MKLAMCVLLGTLSIMGPAHADWQYTRWGMTPQEVKAAAGSKARYLSAEESKNNSTMFGAAILVVPYSTEQFGFEAMFMFDANKLHAVKLTLIEYSRRKSLVTSLVSAYGRPTEDSEAYGSRLMKWFDSKNKNAVQFTDHYGSLKCWIIYSGGISSGL